MDFGDKFRSGGKSYISHTIEYTKMPKITDVRIQKNYHQLLVKFIIHIKKKKKKKLPS
jgi:hypothetical protein